MQGTGSEGAEAATARTPYKFDFAWDSPYGHLIQLMENLGVRDGVVLDLGCGYGAIAEPIRALGAEYLGCDIDPAALANLQMRGFDSIALDLSMPDGLIDRFDVVMDALRGRRVVAVVMGDVLEHLTQIPRFLASLREVFALLGDPLLFVSVPNIAHVDIGAKLAMGRFDYTPTGLLDHTHVSFFTEDRLLAEMAAHGWLQCAESDFRLVKSDQHFPFSHPGLSPGTPLGGYIRHLREQVDNSALVNQFIRVFATTSVPSSVPQNSDDTPTKFLCVLVRTEGLRMENLREALTCLAAQTTDDFNVKVLVHTDSESRVIEVRALVDEFDSHFGGRVSVVHVAGGQRARPLNVGLDLLDASYLAFLDDDDLVTGDWVQVFKDGAAGDGPRIVRSVTVDQQVQRVSSPGSLAPYLIHTRLVPQHAADFDLAQHFYCNQTPICSFAVPAAAIRAFKLRFDEQLPVTEDWEFLMRAVQLTGVVDTKVVTSIYRRWVCDEGSGHKVDISVWDGTKSAILHKFDQAPLLFPRGSASKISGLQSQAALVQRDLELAEQAMQSLRREADEYRLKVDALERSLSWAITAPVRKFLHHARRLSKGK